MLPRPTSLRGGLAREERGWQGQIEYLVEIGQRGLVGPLPVSRLLPADHVDQAVHAAMAARPRRRRHRCLPCGARPRRSRGRAGHYRLGRGQGGLVHVQPDDVAPSSRPPSQDVDPAAPGTRDDHRAAVEAQPVADTPGRGRRRAPTAAPVRLTMPGGAAHTAGMALTTGIAVVTAPSKCSPCGSNRTRTPGTPSSSMTYPWVTGQLGVMSSPELPDEAALDQRAAVLVRPRWCP